MRIIRWALVYFLMISGAFAQTQPDSDLQKQITVYKTDANLHRLIADQLKGENDQLRQRVQTIEGPLFSKYVETKKREYDFQSHMMDVVEGTFQHQRIASYVILLLVFCVVLAGLWFAYVQLMAGLRPVPAIQAAVDPQAVQPGQSGAATPTAPALQPHAVPVGATTFEASYEKLTISSSIVGIVVLVISLAFLYIYTREIYRIQIIDPYHPRIADPEKPSAPPAVKKDK